MFSSQSVFERKIFLQPKTVKTIDFLISDRKSFHELKFRIYFENKHVTKFLILFFYVKNGLIS